MLSAILEEAFHRNILRSQPRPKKHIEDVKKVLVSSIPPPHVTLRVLAKKSDSGPSAEGWIGDKSFLVTINTRACMMITRPDLGEGLPETGLPSPYTLQVASEDTSPSLEGGIGIVDHGPLQT